MQPGFWENMQNASIDNMPQPLKDAYLEANADMKGLEAMFMRDAAHGEYIGEICTKDKKSKMPVFVVDIIEEFLKN